MLELGAGIGDFAANVLRALRDNLGPRGRALFGRLEYHFSDVSEVSIGQELARPGLAPFVASGHVVPSLYDATRDEVPRPLSGREGPRGLTAIFANYLCCVLPTKVLRKRRGALRELYVEEPPGGRAPALPATGGGD